MKREMYVDFETLRHEEFVCQSYKKAALRFAVQLIFEIWYN